MHPQITETRVSEEYRKHIGESCEVGHPEM